MGRAATRSPALKTYFALNAAALLSAAVLMALVAPGSLSLFRLLLVSVAAALAMACAGFATLLHRQPSRERRIATALQARGQRLTLALAVLFLILWCLTWIPPHRTGEVYHYFIGVYPLILSSLLASGLALIYITAAAGGLSTSSLKAYWRGHRVTLIAMSLSLAAFLVIFLLSCFWNILHNNEPYWRGAGVPLLSLQVLIALLIGILAFELDAWLARKPLRLDLALFVLIWAVAAILWSRQPIEESFWVTGPRPPNQEYYPFSDLETFDLGSQFALIGQGIFNRQFWDRALYMSFLVYLHAAGGHNYQQLMSMQAVLFAIFPALLYLVGRRLHSPNAGVILAALTIMRGLNSLTAAPQIHSSTFKHMLTEFPTAIGLAIFVLLLLKWMESPGRRAAAALWAAGVLGLTSLLRPHVLVLLPLLLLTAFLVEPSRRARSLMTSGLMLVAFLAGIAPWTFLGSGANSLSVFYGRRIQDVLSQRYPALFSAPSTSSPPASEPPISAPSESSGQPEVLQATPAAVPTALLPGAWELPRPDDSGQPEVPQATSAAVPTTLPPGARELPPPDDSELPFPALHYLHNMITSAQVFPASPQFISLEDALKRGEGFWGLRWDGRMSSTAAAMLIVSLFVIGLGIGTAYQRLRWRGLVPLAVFLAYHLANAFARTSGGRYLVPVDWILVCYYALGLSELLHLGYSLVRAQTIVASKPTPAPGTPDGPAWSLRTLSTVPALFLIGCLVPLAGVLYPLRYPPQPASALANELVSYTRDMGLRSEAVESFLEEPGAVLFYGRALYPRYYKRGVGVPFSAEPFQERNYPRTMFELIGPHGLVYAILPGPAPDIFPNASDALVLGCETTEVGKRTVRVLVAVLPQLDVAISRVPPAELKCPLPEPVCDNNNNCY